MSVARDGLTGRELTYTTIGAALAIRTQRAIREPCFLLERRKADLHTHAAMDGLTIDLYAALVRLSDGHDDDRQPVTDIIFDALAHDSRVRAP